MVESFKVREVLRLGMQMTSEGTLFRELRHKYIRRLRRHQRIISTCSTYHHFNIRSCILCNAGMIDSQLISLLLMSSVHGQGNRYRRYSLLPSSPRNNILIHNSHKQGPETGPSGMFGSFKARSDLHLQTPSSVCHW